MCEGGPQAFSLFKPFFLETFVGFLGYSMVVTRPMLGVTLQ